MNEYIENLNEEDKKEVLCCETESKSLFMFMVMVWKVGV